MDNTTKRNDFQWQLLSLKVATKASLVVTEVVVVSSDTKGFGGEKRHCH